MSVFTVYTSKRTKVTGGISSLLDHFDCFLSALQAGKEDIKTDTDIGKYFSIYEKGTTGHIFHSCEKLLLGKRI